MGNASYVRPSQETARTLFVHTTPMRYEFLSERLGNVRVAGGVGWRLFGCYDSVSMYRFHDVPPCLFVWCSAADCSFLLICCRAKPEYAGKSDLRLWKESEPEPSPELVPTEAQKRRCALELGLEFLPTPLEPRVIETIRHFG